MFKAVLQSVAAIALGLLAAFAMVVAIEGLSAVIHPFPPGIDPADYDACLAHVAGYPQWLLGVSAVAWGLTSFVGAWLATRLGASRHFAHGIGVGALLLLAAVGNMLMLPYPLWFEVAGVALISLGIVAGVRLGAGSAQGAKKQD